jgi:hypothetical protein
MLKNTSSPTKRESATPAAIASYSHEVLLSDGAAAAGLDLMRRTAVEVVQWPCEAALLEGMLLRQLCLVPFLSAVMKRFDHDVSSTQVSPAAAPVPPPRPPFCVDVPLRVITEPMMVDGAGCLQGGQVTFHYSLTSQPQTTAPRAACPAGALAEPFRRLAIACALNELNTSVGLETWAAPPATVVTTSSWKFRHTWVDPSAFEVGPRHTQPPEVLLHGPATSREVETWYAGVSIASAMLRRPLFANVDEDDSPDGFDCADREMVTQLVRLIGPLPSDLLTLPRYIALQCRRSFAGGADHAIHARLDRVSSTLARATVNMLALSPTSRLTASESTSLVLESADTSYSETNASSEYVEWMRIALQPEPSCIPHINVWTKAGAYEGVFENCLTTRLGLAAEGVLAGRAALDADGEKVNGEVPIVPWTKELLVMFANWSNKLVANAKAHARHVVEAAELWRRAIRDTASLHLNAITFAAAYAMCVAHDAADTPLPRGVQNHLDVAVAQVLDTREKAAPLWALKAEQLRLIRNGVWTTRYLVASASNLINAALLPGRCVSNPADTAATWFSRLLSVLTRFSVDDTDDAGLLARVTEQQLFIAASATVLSCTPQSHRATPTSRPTLDSLHEAKVDADVLQLLRLR